MKMVENIIHETEFENMKIEVIETTYNRYLKLLNINNLYGYRRR